MLENARNNLPFYLFKRIYIDVSKYQECLIYFFNPFQQRRKKAEVGNFIYLSKKFYLEVENFMFKLEIGMLKLVITEAIKLQTNLPNYP